MIIQRRWQENEYVHSVDRMIPVGQTEAHGDK